MRSPRETDFFVELPDVGTFRFGRRTYGDRLKIRTEYLRLVQEFGDSDPDLSMYAGMIATHSVLCVEAPKGWEDLATIEIVGPVKVEDKIFELYGLFKSKEDTFRQVVVQGGEAPGA